MAWIESHQSLGTHRKLYTLCLALDIDEPQAVGMLHYLWWWALDNAPDGDITGVDDLTLCKISHYETIVLNRARTAHKLRESAAKLRESAAKLRETLCNAGFIDDDNAVQRLHNWDDYAGKLVAKRVSNRRYQRE